MINISYISATKVTNIYMYIIYIYIYIIYIYIYNIKCYKRCYKSYISYISATKATRGVTNVCGCDAKDCINPAGLLDD